MVMQIKGYQNNTGQVVALTIRCKVGAVIVMSIKFIRIARGDWPPENDGDGYWNIVFLGAKYLGSYQGYCSIYTTKINQVWVIRKWRETAPIKRSWSLAQFLTMSWFADPESIRPKEWSGLEEERLRHYSKWFLSTSSEEPMTIQLRNHTMGKGKYVHFPRMLQRCS